MKHVIILGDGMADEPIAALGNKTPMQFADTPSMDRLAKLGVTGRMKTVTDGFHPGSEVANMAILGYDLPTVYEGRGVLEAASMGVDLKPDEMALRCNLICIEGDHIKNHSSGNIPSEEASVLIDFLNEQLGSDRVKFHSGVSYRHLLVIKNGDKRLDCTPPHDVPLHAFRPLMVKPLAKEAEETADLINHLILRSQEILPNHPINLKRVAEGKDPANSIWPWSPGYRPAMKTMREMFGIKKGAVISAVDLIRGIGVYAGLEVINVEGATGLSTTNYEGKAEAAVEALRKNDFVYVHVEASDEAGHDGDMDLKVKTIEYLDHRLISHIVEATQDWDEPVAIAVLPDHPTPCAIRTHTATPIPFLMYKPGIEPDTVKVFDEFSVLNGKYGILQKDEFIKTFLSL